MGRSGTLARACRGRRVVPLLETAYRLDVDWPTWLRGLAEQVGALVSHELGVIAWLFTVQDGSVRIDEVASFDGGERFESVLRDGLSAPRPEIVSRFFRPGVF